MSKLLRGVAIMALTIGIVWGCLAATVATVLSYPALTIFVNLGSAMVGAWGMQLILEEKK